MTKTVMNMASPIKTELGGTCWVPMAVLKREKTITILKNPVTEIKKNGTSVTKAIARTKLMLLENWGAARSELKLRLTPSGVLVWARAGMTNKLENKAAITRYLKCLRCFISANFQDQSQKYWRQIYCRQQPTRLSCPPLEYRQKPVAPGKPGR